MNNIKATTANLVLECEDGLMRVFSFADHTLTGLDIFAYMCDHIHLHSLYPFTTQDKSGS
jgi:hypothetical protein